MFKNKKKRKRVADSKGIDLIKRQHGVINTLHYQLAEKDAIINDMHKKQNEGFISADDGLQAEDDEHAVAG